jgi:hypothetical protein
VFALWQLRARGRFSVRQRAILAYRMLGVYVVGRCVVPIAGQHAHAVNAELLVHVQPIPRRDIIANLLNFILPVAILAQSRLQEGRKIKMRFHVWQKSLNTNHLQPEPGIMCTSILLPLLPLLR